MTPIFKAHALSFSLATSIVFVFRETILQIKTEFAIINFILSFVMSLTFYKILFKLFLFVCNKSHFVKRIILSDYYFEGLWIGYYIVENEVEYYYEFFEQGLDELTIKGKFFDKNGAYLGEWTILNPNINTLDSKLTYYYEMNVVSSDDITLGYSRATIFYDKHHKAHKLMGFAVDSYSTNKQPYTSLKVLHTGNFEEWLEENFINEVKKIYTKMN